MSDPRDQLRQALDRKYDVKVNGKMTKSSCGKTRDKEMVIDIFRFICEHPSAKGHTLNITAYAAERIEAGTVMVNEVVYTHGIAQTPWGGVKDSGYGRTHGRAGLLELVTSQHIHVNRISFLPDLWWFRYNQNAAKLFGGLARRFTTGSLMQTSLLLPQIVRRWFERG